MSYDPINIGSAPNDGNGDTGRDGAIKINAMFAELYEEIMGVTINPDAATHDAFARMRVSNPETVFDSKQIHDSQPLFWDSAVTGSATETYTKVEASTKLAVAASSADTALRQTLRRFNYQPGKSQLVFMTSTLKSSGSSGAGLVRGFGFGDDDNGFFLVDDEGTINLVRRTNYTATAVDNAVDQASWNLDTFDGNGDSGITLDFTKAQILLLDMEWLGVGRVRMGFVIDGIPYYAHQFVWANSGSGVYMSTPNLPIRYWIENDSNYASSAEIEHICCSVMSEGGTQAIGMTRSALGATVSATSSAIFYAAIGIRLKSTNLDASIDIKKLSLLATSPNDNCRWYLCLNPTLTLGTLTYNDQTDSSVQIATGGGTQQYTSPNLGHILDAGLFSTSTPFSDVVNSAIKLGAKIDGTPDEIVLVIQPITSNISVKSLMTWQEIS